MEHFLGKREGAELYFALGMRIMGKLSLAYLYNGLSAVDEKQNEKFSKYFVKKD